MKKLALSIFSTFSYLFTATIAYAQTATPTPTPIQTPIDTCADAGMFKAVCQLGSGKQGIGPVLGGFIGMFFVVAAIIAVIYLIFGGVKWITSRGEKTEVEAARNHIIAAIVGLIMVFLAFFLINFVLGFFIEGFSVQNIQLPSLTKGPTTTP